MKIKKYVKWGKDVKCRSCKTVLTISEKDVQSCGAFGSNDNGIEYFVVCAGCGCKVVMERTSFDPRSDDPVPPHVKQAANERERLEILRNRT